MTQTSNSFLYSNTFTLNKHYLCECYDESVVLAHSWLAYGRAFSLMLVALILFNFTETDTVISAFILILGLVDAAGTYYHKAWWLARQALSSSYNTEVNLVINEEGIKTQSTQVNNTILWANINQVQQSNRGLLIHHSNGKSYLSSSVLNNPAIEYIQSQIKTTSCED